MELQPLISVITINYNNAQGLDKTLASVNAQTCKLFEHVIVDGGSTDGSVDIIKKYDDGNVDRRWVSEPDKGIYNAMNKGIRMAKGKYLQFLNSGDYLVDNGVLGRIATELQKRPDEKIIYGNMIALTKKGRLARFVGLKGSKATAWTFYHGAITHSAAYISKSLFEAYGYYNEENKIVSDWEWYFDLVYYHSIQPAYVNTDVTCFNLSGISETNHELNAAERRKVIERIIPSPVLADYDRWKLEFISMQMVKRHSWAIGLYKAIVKLATFSEKIQSRINSMKLKKEYKKKGIFLE